MAKSVVNTPYLAMVLLNYLYAPVVGIYFLGAAGYALAILQRAKPISRKRRVISITLSLVTLIGFIGEVLYYLTQALADATYIAPHYAAIRCLGAILVWIPLISALTRGNSLVWHPYFGAFVAQFLFEAVICLLRGFTLPPHDRYNNIPLAISAARCVASILLVLDGVIILVQKHMKKGTDDEEQPLLGAQATTQNGSAEEDDKDAPVFDKVIKEQQAKRLEEQGGWFGYLKSFVIFLPYLLPKDDWRVMLCLFTRVVHLILRRALNLLEPRQLGIITNKLVEGSRIMPWLDIGLWMLFRWMNSSSGLSILDNFAQTGLSNLAFERMKDLAYKHLLSLSMDFHTSKDSGEVLKAVDQASSLNSLIEVVLFGVLPIFIDLFVAMYYVTCLFDAYMTFIILFMGMAYVWLGFIVTTILQPRRRTWVKKQRIESAIMNETVHNWQTVAYFNRITYERDRYLRSLRATIRANYAFYFRATGGQAAQNLLLSLGFTAACVFAISQIITGDKPVGNLITLIMYWGTLTSPLVVMSNSFQHITHILINAERLLQLLNTKPTVADCKDAQDLVVKTGEVEFKDVEFAYDGRQQMTKKVSFLVGGGQTVAFVGASGGGKSTIFQLLLRSYDVTGGSIFIDGQDLRSVTLSTLRDSLGLVPQNATLFNQTIRQNVQYAKLDATNAEIEEACWAASIHDDIVSFHDGYKTKVGERGVRLSGGQLQRIAIARVLLKSPKIVMLDEATSAIDSITEAQIQEALKKLSKGRTTFVIAHRLSTIMKADQIFVVDQGEIIERGTHSELLDLGGKYFALWMQQTAGTLSQAGRD
jgi:ABC-type transport system involved in Fe-S cluster assembly fused permease/ATPase subunit